MALFVAFAEEENRNLVLRHRRFLRGSPGKLRIFEEEEIEVLDPVAEGNKESPFFPLDL